MNASKTEKALYWFATTLALALMGWSVIMYHLRAEMAAGFFRDFGYPTYIVYPLAYLKLIAMLVILTNRYNNLKEIAYGAYYINMIVATAAHLIAGHNPWHAYVGLIVVPVSYYLSNKVRGRPSKDLFLAKVGDTITPASAT